jgi:hypothetical protein
MSDLPELPAIRLGHWRHYKGGEYEVQGVVRHSETLEPLVLYRPLKGSSGRWVRPHAMFLETVEIDGVELARFEPQMPPPDAPSLLTGHCHCGAVRITLPHAPERLTDCNCSLCRRIGGLWGYFEPSTVQIEGHPEHTEGYVQGDKTLRTVRCKHCGGVTHWEPITPQENPRMGINLRNFDRQWVATLPVRRFDGADTWAFID